MTTPQLALLDVSKDYHGLRPLRLAALRVDAGDLVAIVGLDQHAAEVFVNLVTGAVAPDRGEVRAFGRPTTEIGDAAEWLAFVDRFGIVSGRAVLLDALTVLQNLAMPFTLDIEPPPPDVLARATALAREVGLPEPTCTRPAGELDAADRARLRLGRALALDPAIVLLEHPSADLLRPDVAPLARQIRAVAERRRATVVAVTADEEFAGIVATRVLRLDAATGRLSGRSRGRWFGRGCD